MYKVLYSRHDYLRMLTALSLLAVCFSIFPTHAVAQDERRLALSLDPLVKTERGGGGDAMCIEELEALYEMDMLLLELASEEYKKGREKKESEEGYTDQLVILYNGTCTPSKKVKDANEKVKDPWRGKAIDCSATPQPAECQGATHYPTSYYYKTNADGTKVKVEIPLGEDQAFVRSLPQSQ